MLYLGPEINFLYVGKPLIWLAPRAGFEPATNRLTAGCSTAELPGKSLLGVVEAAYNKADPGLKAAAAATRPAAQSGMGKTNPKRRRKSLRSRTKSRPPHVATRQQRPQFDEKSPDFRSNMREAPVT